MTTLLRTLPVLLMLGCSASTQKPAVDQVLADDELRSESFEATLRVLDEHPAYVDEFFNAALRHTPTLDRFISDTAAELSDDGFARLTARHLTRHPEGLRQIMIATLDESSDEPAALQAIAQAMTARPHVAAMVTTANEQTLIVTMRALMDEIMKNADARDAFLESLQENSPELAQLITNNPDSLKTLVEALAKSGVQKLKPASQP
jgi:hypothetical protein